MFCMLSERGVPKYLVMLLYNWYANQKLFIRWAGMLSEGFGMRNGIRQGSCLSPKMFNVYVDQLNYKLGESKVGCHVSQMCTNNFSFADDLVLAAPDARSLNVLLAECDKFAREFYITYSTIKTEAMVIKPRGMHFKAPDIFLSGTKICYVQRFKYLGHIITNEFTDDADIDREIRNLYIRGNTIARKFGFLDNDIKCSLFKTYCYPLYTSSLWASYNQGTINRMKVCYNDVMRTLFNVPRYSSATTLAVQNGIRSFFENIHIEQYSLFSRLTVSNNCLIYKLLHSDSFTVSLTRRRWYQSLYAYNPRDVYML